MGTKMHNQFRVSSIVGAAAITTALALSARAGQISTMEGDVNPAHQPPGTGEPTAYTWGDSFDSNQVDHLPSILGITDGLGSMNVRKPAGGFSWGIQYMFNDPANQSRYLDLVGAGTTDLNGNFTLTQASHTKIMMDITVPNDPNVAYSVGFGAVNYGFVTGGFPGYFIDSYNPGGGGNYMQFANSPMNLPAWRTQTYTWDLAGEFTGNGVAVWDQITNYMLFHFNVNSGTLAVDSNSYWDHFRVVNQDITTRSTWQTATTGDWNNASNWAHGVPNGVGAPAIFYSNNPNTANDGTTVLSAVTVTANINSAVTVGSIIFDTTETKYTSNGVPGTNRGDVNYVVGGSGGLTFDVASGISEIYMISGSASINVPVTVNDSMDIDTSAGFGPDSGAPSGGRWSSVPATELTFGNSVSLASGSTLTTRGAGTVRFNGGVSGGSVTVNGGVAFFGATANIAGLTLGPATRAHMTLNGNNVIRAGSLALGSVSNGTQTVAATLDLSDNDLIVTSGSTAAIAALVAAARNGGAWDQPGITSSAAVGHPQGATTLGVLSGAEYNGVNGAPFDGFAIANGDSLVKYTWYGDTDFNGVVDFDDYVRIDGGFNGGLTGWLNGDFDLSGAIDFDDYVLIDLGFNVQNGTLRRAMSYIDGSDRSLAEMNAPSLKKVVEHFEQFGTDYGTHFLSAVPEPTGISAVALSAIAGLARRQRRCASGRND